jgi:hypothetical protein
LTAAALVSVALCGVLFGFLLGYALRGREIDAETEWRNFSDLSEPENRQVGQSRPALYDYLKDSKTF